MCPDIFSSFDPHTASLSSVLPIGPYWMLSLLALLPLIPTYWIRPTRHTWLFFLPISATIIQLSRTSGRHLLGWNTTLLTIFIILISVNLIGLIPYTFSSSRHLLFTFTFGLTAWFAVVCSAFSFHPLQYLAHLIPLGVPMFLSPFLASVETTSVTVRPSTLSFRLAANISAGHVVISLLGIYSATAFFASTTLLLVLLSSLVGYFLFELGICFIQALIFTLLLSLYTREHPEPINR